MNSSLISTDVGPNSAGTPKGTLQEKWPVILNTTLAESDLRKALQTQQQKIRISSTTVENSCIFPLSGIAFLLIRLSDTPWSNCGPRIEKLMKVHRNGYVILVAPTFNEKELSFLVDLQNKYLFTKLNFMPCHSEQECTQVMLMIAKVTCKPYNAALKGRLDKVVQRQTSSPNLINTLKLIGLSADDCENVVGKFNSLEQIISATPCELSERGVSATAIGKLAKFREEDEAGCHDN